MNRPSFRALAALSLGLPLVALACFSDIADSVHFNTGDGRFELPPSPLVIATWSESETRNTRTLNPGWDDQERQEAATTRKELLLKRTAPLEEAGKFDEARAEWQTIFADGDGFVRDRVEVLSAPEAFSRSDLGRYLALRRAVETGGEGAGAAMTAFARESQLSPRGRAFATYAAGVAASEDRSLARAHFEATVALGEFNQDRARWMLVQTLLGSGATPNAEERARAAVLLTELSARGEKDGWRLENWRVRMTLLSGDRGAAFVQYLRLLDQTTGEDRTVNVLASLRLVGRRLDDRDADTVRKAIEVQPDLLRPYLIFRVYHTGPSASELAGLQAFASRILESRPELPLGPELDARLAEIALLSGDWKSASRFAGRSLASAKEGQNLALFVRASVLRHEGKPREALTILESLAVQGGYLRIPAREHAALLRERIGDWKAAYRHYEKLGYSRDAGYLLDVRMPLRDLAELRQTSQGAERDRLTLALAYRRMRRDDLDGARTLFAALGKSVRHGLLKSGAPEAFVVAGSPRPGKPGDPWERIPDPVVTIDQLRALRARQRVAAPAARAEAFLAEAEYLYQRRNLLFYNPAIWSENVGSRSSLLGMFWNESAAVPEDESALKEHHYEHECLAKVEVLCRRARAIGTPRQAARALYREATALRRLGEFNAWWRKEDARRNLMFGAANRLAELARRYPEDPLAPKARKYARVFRQEAAQAASWRRFE